MPLRAQFAEIRTFSHSFQPRVLLKKLPSLILRIIPHLLLPRAALAGPMARVRTERGKRSLVTILPFAHNANSYSCYLQSTRSALHSAEA